MKITIFGLPGTGTSTAGKILAQELGFVFRSSGDIFRQMAADLGLNVNEFNHLAENGDKYDQELDFRVRDYGLENDNFVFDSHLGWHFIPDSIKVGLVCDYGERIRRITNREEKDFSVVEQETKDREGSMAGRYLKYYGVVYPPNYSDLDLVIDTTTINPEGVVKNIIDFIKTKTNCLNQSNLK